MTECRSCRAAIFWAVTTAGKRIPVDAVSVPDGNLVLDGGDPPIAAWVPTGELLIDDPPRYVSHFATCPNAEHHRKSPA